MGLAPTRSSIGFQSRQQIFSSVFTEVRILASRACGRNTDGNRHFEHLHACHVSGTGRPVHIRLVDNH